MKLSSFSIMTEGRDIVVFILIFGAFAVTPTQAQDFQTPIVATTSGMIEGMQYNITCTCVSVGANVTLSWYKGNQPVSSLGQSCAPFSGLADTYQCSSTYTFTARRTDIGVQVSCVASLNNVNKSEGSTLYVLVPPPAEYPSITGPDAVRANVNNSWTCVTDGALPSANLGWRVGTDNRPGVQQTSSENSDRTFRTSSTIYEVFSSDQDSRTLRCEMQHDTGPPRTTEKIVTVQYEPIVTSNPTTVTATEDINTRLQCSVRASPAATTVDWLKNSQAIDRTGNKYIDGNTQNPTLEINQPQKEDSGVYECFASNSLGNSTGPNITLAVQYSPRITIPQSSYSNSIGSSLTIPCNIDADPVVTSVIWKKKSGGTTIDVAIPSGGKYSGGTPITPSLTINNLASSDAGEYNCTATNSVKTRASNSTTVIVSYAPTNITATPDSLQVNETQLISVTCTASGEPVPTYAWYKLPSSTAVSNSQVLNIASAQREDSGQYRCIATNVKGSADVIVQISVWYKPVLTPQPSPQGVTELSNIILVCAIDSNPSPYTVTWHKYGVTVDRSNSRYSGGNTVANPNLTISNIETSDAGNYTCSVNNVIGSTTSGVIQVTVTFAPRNVALSPSDPIIYLNETDSLTVTCTADGIPAPGFVWKAGSTEIATGSSLVITSAGPTDNRDVTCEVSNFEGTRTKTATIDVSYIPRVTIPGGNAFGVDEGNSLTIPCIVDTHPETDTFNWLRDSNVLDLSDGTKYGGGTRSSRNLTIYSLSSSDSGNYSCRSVNIVGSTTSREVIVTISYKPENVQVEPATATVTEGSQFVITCSARGVPSPTFSWYRNSVKIQNGAVLNVTSAQTQDDGLYTCQATNVKGSTNVTMAVVVQYKARVTSPDKKIADIGENVTVGCNIVANPNITSVTWQMVNDSLVSTLNISNSNGKYDGGTVSNPSLFIKDFGLGDLGWYQCRGTNSVGTGSGPYVIVSLASSPKTVTFTPSAVSVNEGETIDVTCSSDGVPTPTYVWLRAGVDFSVGSQLQINSATPADNAEFTCRATNNKGSITSVLSINVSYRPRGSNTNPVYRTSINRAITLNCETDANPAATSYEWTFGGETLSETGSSLQVTPTQDSEFGNYICKATNTIGTSDPISITLEKDTDQPGARQSVAAAGLSTPITVLIVLLILLLIVIIIVIIIICYKKGKCKCLRKKDPKSRVGPAVVASTEITPRPTDKPITEANSGIRSPQWSAVSRQHVNVNVDNQSREPEKLSIEDETRENGHVPNGNIAGGTIISIPDGNTPRPHHLPPVDAPPERKKKRRRKKKKHDADQEQTTDHPVENAIHEEEEEEE